MHLVSPAGTSWQGADALSGTTGPGLMPVRPDLVTRLLKAHLRVGKALSHRVLSNVAGQAACMHAEGSDVLLQAFWLPPVLWEQAERAGNSLPVCRWCATRRSSSLPRASGSATAKTSSSPARWCPAAGPRPPQETSTASAWLDLTNV